MTASFSHTFTITYLPIIAQKLYWHEWCAHVGWDQFIFCIRKGFLPCDSSLALEPDPVCAACQFRKAHKGSHLTYVGNIAANHSAPGEASSTDGMEAGTPSHVFSASSIPSSRKHHSLTFWIEIFSTYVHITMHETTCAEEFTSFQTWLRTIFCQTWCQC